MTEIKHNIYIVLLLMFVIVKSTYSQEHELLSTCNVLSIGGGGAQIHDGNISSLTYTGLDVFIDAQFGNFYKKGNGKVSWLNRNNICYAKLRSPAGNAHIRYGAITSGYGAAYHLHPAKNFTLMMGGISNLDIATKYNKNNENNVVSVDFAITLNALIKARYTIPFEKTKLSFQYNVCTPLIGCMFVPEMGMSYFEIYTYTPKLRDVLFLSSPHNKTGIKGDFSVDFILDKIRFRAGFIHEYRQWSANYLSFNDRKCNFYIGILTGLSSLKRQKSANQ